MPETSIAEAKAHLTHFIHRAEQGEMVRITRRGKPVAVLLSEDAYARLSKGQETSDFGTLVAEMRADPAFQPIDWTPEEIDAWRDRRPWREFTWPE